MGALMFSSFKQLCLFVIGLILLIGAMLFGYSAYKAKTGGPILDPKYSGSQLPTFYMDTAKNKIVSKLSFDEIGKRVAFIQNKVGVSDGGQPDIYAYVFFDPLCPHCAQLETNMLRPDAIHIVNNIAWVPIGILDEFSTLQGATILGSPSPAITMAKHAANVLHADKAYDLNVKLAKQEDIDAVVANTKIWSDAGADQVPFIVTKDKQGKTYSIYGVLEGFQMAEFVSKPK